MILFLRELRDRIRHSCSYDVPSLHDDCTEFEVNNWTISRFVLDRLVPVVGVHPFPLNEQMLMVAAVCRLRPALIFEWGTNIGTSARIFHETCMSFGLSSVIHSVDLPDDIEHPEHPRRKRGMLVAGRNGIHLHQGDGLETALRILSDNRAAQRTLFFIDGDHEYSSVKRELEGIIREVPIADILLHDTFYQSPGSSYNVGPHRAIMDVLATVPGRFRVFSQSMGLPGMTLLWQAKDAGPGNPQGIRLR